MKQAKKWLAGLLLAAFAVSAFAQTAVILSTQNMDNKGQTYRSGVSTFTLASSATDIFQLIGSATKNLYIKSITVSPASTNATAVPFTISVYKRTAVDSGGTAVTLVNAKMNTANAAATGVAKYYTANPSTVGTGLLLATRRASVVSGVQPTSFTFSFGEWLQQYAVLTGTAESLAVSLEGGTVTSGTAGIDVEWMER